MPRNKLLFPIFLAAVILLLPRALGAQESGKLKVPDGTILRLALLDALSSATNNVDDPINFEITEDVKIGEVVALPKGTTARGHVVEVQSKRRMGRAGKLNFSVDYARAPDGTNLRLRANSNRQGEEKSGTVIVGTVLLSPLFLIMRGKDVEIAKGTTFNAYIDGDREISLGGKAPVTAAATPASGGGGLASAAPAAPPPTTASEDLTTAVIKTDPPGADVTVDGKYMGSTPSTVRLAPGDHSVSLEKAGFKAWQRTVTVNPGGIVTIDATLTRAQ